MRSRSSPSLICALAAATALCACALHAAASAATDRAAAPQGGHVPAAAQPPAPDQGATPASPSPPPASASPAGPSPAGPASVSPATATVARIPAGTRAATAASPVAAAPAALGYSASYEASWHGIPLGKLSLDLRDGAGGVATQAQMATSGVAALFTSTRLHAQAIDAIQESNIRMERYVLDHVYGHKSRHIVVEATPSGVQAVSVPAFNAPHDVAATQPAKDSSRDPLSTLVSIGFDVAAAKTCARTYTVYDGRHLYDLAMTPINGRPVKGTYTGRVVGCRVRYTLRAGYDPKTRRANVPDAEIWWATDVPSSVAMPLRVSFPAPLGDVVISLRRLSLAAPALPN